MIVMFFWQVIGAIVLKLGEIHGGIDPLDATLTVFMAASYGVLLFRGIGEWRAVRGDHEHAEWLRQAVRDNRLRSPGMARRDLAP